MAAPSNVTLYNDITLRSVGLLLEDIHERAPDWDARPEDERADFHLEWEGLVGRLEGAVEDDRDGTLTPEQQSRLRELAREVVSSREVILRLGLVYPDLGHLLDGVPMTTAERVDHELWSLQHGAARLRALAEVWHSSLVDRGTRRALPREWDGVVELFGQMEALAAGGELRASAREQLRQVAEELTELLPTMRRLGLRLPDLDALARARRVEAA
jgi:hypothetical protein